MWQLIAYIFIIILSILGFSFIIENLCINYLKPKNAPPYDIIIYLKKDMAISQITSAYYERVWVGSKKIKRIICVNDGINDDEKIEAKEILYKNKDIYIENRNEDLNKFLEK